jgi:hypothetical protein
MVYLHGYMVVALDGPLSEGFQHLSGRREVPQSPTQRVPANILKAREVANSGTSG